MASAAVRPSHRRLRRLRGIGSNILADRLRKLESIPEGAELSETYQWTIDDVTSTLRIEGTTLTQTPGPADDPAVAVTTTKAWMTDLVAGKTDWTQGKTTGAVQVQGSSDAWERKLVATAQPGADITILDRESRQ